MIRLFALITLPLCAAAGSAVPEAQLAPGPGPGAASAPDWRALARRDVVAAYEQFAANHPGMHDPANRRFPAQLKAARDAALARAGFAADANGFAEALAVFTARLSDGHAQVFAHGLPSSGPASLEWPGFVAAWRGESMLVYHASPSSPAPEGARIVSCDGERMPTLVRKRLLLTNFRPGEAGQWWSKAHQAFVSYSRSEVRPQACVFRFDGKQQAARLTWSPAPAELNPLLIAAGNGDRTEIGMSQPRPGIVLVGLPDFNPNEAGRQAYRTLFRSMADRRGEFVDARAVVLDLRHNNGGSSSWSRQVAEALWGKETVARKMTAYFSNATIWWRASSGNIGYLDEIEREIRTTGDAALAGEIKKTADAMRVARARGLPYHKVATANVVPRADATALEVAFTVPVYVIVPGRCSSACLDALDVFTRFSNVKLVGAPSSADSNYLEVRTADLPSGHGRVVIPIKVWMGRPRPSGYVYRPNIPVRERLWSTPVFLDHVERDLARGRQATR
jgi:hypothetical protein